MLYIHDTTAGELVTFSVLFVLPISLCSSPALPMQVLLPMAECDEALTYFSSERYNFLCFAIPVVINFCGQGIFDLRILKSIQKDRWKLIFNAIRTGVFITLLLISASLCTVTAATVQQKCTISAAFLVAITIVPTAFVSHSAIQKLLRTLRIYSVPHAVKANSKSEFNSTHFPNTPGRDVVSGLGKPLDTSTQALGVALAVYA
jgi:hypothetical protein